MASEASRDQDTIPDNGVPPGARALTERELQRNGEPAARALLGGYFKMGRYLQLEDQLHNNLLVSVCNAMGLADVNSFGIPSRCTGALTGLAG